MPGFVAPSATPKARTGKPNRPKRSAEARHPFREKAVDPLQHASPTIPAFPLRHRLTNGKTGFNSKPGQPGFGRLTVRPSAPSRGSGKEHRAKG